MALDDVNCDDLLMPEHERGARYRELFEDAPFAYFTVVPSGVITGVNRKAAALLGRSPDELVGSDVLDLYGDSPWGRSRAEALLEGFRQGAPIEDEELAMRRGDGRAAWVRLTVVPAFDEAGRIVESRSIIVDITHLREPSTTRTCREPVSLHR